jgi:hypothetical protein
MGRHQKGLLVAAEYKWMGETNTGHVYLEANC